MRATVIIVLLLFSGVLLGAEQQQKQKQKQKDPEPGTYYPYGQVGVQKKELEGTKLKLIFKPRDEQFYWCPGVRVQTTKKATIVTFVRCKTSKNFSVDQRATIGKRLIRTVTIETKGLDTYVFNGPKKYQRIHHFGEADEGSESTENPTKQVIENEHVTEQDS